MDDQCRRSNSSLDLLISMKWYSKLLNELVIARNAADLSQQDVEHKLRLPTGMLSRWEGGTRKITVETVHRLGVLYGATFILGKPC